MSFKNIIALFFCLCVSLYSAPLNTNLIQKVEQTSLYQNAFNAYQDKSYETSFKLFGELLHKYPSNVKINYYYGRSAYELKNYEFAYGAYDRILINEPMNHRVRLEYGRTLLMMGSNKEAKKEFEKVLASPIPEQVRKNVESFIAAIESKEKNYIFNGVAIFGLEWDTNIDNSTYETNNNVIQGLINSNTDRKRGSSLINIMIGNLIVPFKSNKRLGWETTALTYTQRQNQYRENDIFLASISTGLSVVGKNFKNTSSFLYDNVWLGGDRELYIYGLGNSLRYKLDASNLFTFNTKLQKKKMVQDKDRTSTTTRDSTVKEVSLEYSLLMSNKDRITLASTANIERKDKGTRTDVSKNTYKYKVAYSKPLPYELTLDLSCQYDKSKYKIESAGIKRKDDKRRYSLKLTKKLDKQQSIYTEFARVDNRSNNNIYSYKRNTYNINYMIMF